MKNQNREIISEDNSEVRTRVYVILRDTLNKSLNNLTRSLLSLGEFKQSYEGDGTYN